MDKNQYKLYCINEDKNIIVKGFNTNDKTKIKNEVKSYVSKIYPDKKLSENFIITSNPQKHGLNPKDSASWINVKKEVKKEAIVKYFTDKIYESIVEGGYLSDTLNKKYNIPANEIAEKKNNFEEAITFWLKNQNENMSSKELAALLKAKIDEIAADEEAEDSETNLEMSNLDDRNFNESIKKLVTQNINESLITAYEETINEAYGDKIGTGMRNMFSWGGKGTIPPATYAAARDLGRAWKTFMSAWNQYTPLLGDDPNATDYNANASLKNVENAMRTLPRFAGVQDISRPRRQELIGKYFVSQKNYDANVAKKAGDLSKQQINAANAQITAMQAELNSLQVKDSESQFIIDELNKSVAQLMNNMQNKDTDINALNTNIKNLETQIMKLEKKGAVDQKTITKLKTKIENLNKTLNAKDKKIIDATAKIAKQDKEISNQNATIDNYIARQGY